MRLLLVLAMALPAAAQLGARVGATIDVQARIKLITGIDYVFHGIALDSSGNYWATAQRNTATATHKLFKLSSTGVYRGQWDQPAATTASATGMLDLAYDPATNTLWGGFEHAHSGNRVLAFNVSASQFDPSRDWLVPNNAPGISVRALAHDPFGNMGQQSMWAGDGNSRVYEFDRNGVLLRSFANINPQTTGCAIDIYYRMAWWFGSAGSAKPGCSAVALAMDLASGVANGQAVVGDPTAASGPTGGIAAGCEWYVHNDLTAHLEPRLLLLVQGQVDTAYNVLGRYGIGAACGGTIGMAGDAAFVTNPNFAVTLAGSSSANAALLVSATQRTLPLLPPLFGTGCYAHVDLGNGLVVLGPQPIVGGRAQLNIPITAGTGFNVYFQWVEVGATAQPPLLLSDGAGVRVY